MKNAIEFERVKNGWIVRSGMGESVTCNEPELASFLTEWLDNGGREAIAQNDDDLVIRA
jgi:hypothetical protein